MTLSPVPISPSEDRIQALVSSIPAFHLIGKRFLSEQDPTDQASALSVADSKMSPLYIFFWYLQNMRETAFDFL